MPNIDWVAVKGWFLDQGIWFLVTLAIALFAYLVLRKAMPRGARGIVKRLRPGGTEEELKKRAHFVSQLLVWLGTIVIAAGGVFAILGIAGVDIYPALGAVGRTVGLWLGTKGLRIAIIVLLAALLQQFLRRFIPRAVEVALVREKRRRAREEVKKRGETLSRFLGGALAVVIWLIAGFMILAELGVNIAPLLAGAGVVGIAIGFGAQSLVRDVVSGLFIIMENQYGKGDVIRIADIAGLVEDLNIRRTVLRDLDGIVHIVPNGEIRVASNFTKEFSRANINVSVGYGEDLDHAIEVINRVGREMAEDEYWGPRLLTSPQALRVDSLGDSGIEIKVLGDTKPLEQWAVMGELRKRIKEAFDEEGIEIPWPHTKVYFGNVPERPPMEPRKREPQKVEINPDEVLPPEEESS